MDIKRNKGLIYIGLFALFLLILMIYQYKAGTRYIDSDMSGLMVYAQHLNEEKSMVSENWFYSTEISYLDECHLYKITLALFPDNWHAARVIAKGIALLLTSAAFIYMCYGAKMKEEAILGAIVLIAPFGCWQTYHMVFDPSYTTSVFYLALIYGAILHISSNGKHLVLHYLIMVIISLLAGLAGPRLLLVAMAPIMVASLITYGIKAREKGRIVLKNSIEFSLVKTSIMSSLIVLVGYIINSRFLANKYTFADSSQYWRTFSISDILASLSDLFSNFGYVGLFYGETDVMTISGLVTGGFGIFFSIAIVFMYIRLLRRIMELKSQHRFIVFAGVFSISICSIFFGLMEGLGGGNGGYYITIIAVIIADAIIEISTEDYKFKYSKNVVVIGLLIAICMLSVVHSKLFVDNGGYRHPDGIEGVVAAIEQNDVSAGYASFWNASIMTEISNGDIETWAVEDLVTSGLVIKPWFQDKRHMVERPTGRVFIAALTNDECANMLSIPGMLDKLVYQSGDSNMLFVFDSVEEMVKYVPLAD